MPTELKMPQLGESVHEGTISRWLKKPGERVDKYEPLLEVATDKVESEVTAPEGGIVQQILVPEGETVKVGTLLAIIDGAQTLTPQPSLPEQERGGSGTVTPPSLPGNPPVRRAGGDGGLGSPSPTSPPPPPLPGEGRQSPPSLVGKGDGGLGLAQERGGGAGVTPPSLVGKGAGGLGETLPTTSDTASDGGRGAGARVSPLAARIALDAGVNLDNVPGTGPGGQVTKEDVLRALQAQAGQETGGKDEGEQAAGEQGSRGAEESGRGGDRGIGRQGDKATERYGNRETEERGPAERGVGTFLSPRVQMLASQLNVDLSQVRGTGKDGRITGRDVEAFAEARRSAPAVVTPAVILQPPVTPSPMPTPTPASGEGGKVGGVDLMPGDEVVPLTLMRRVIAEHMLRSKQTAPHVTTVHEADVTRMVQFFKANFDGFRQREGFNLTYTPFFVQAVVNALKGFPQINVAFTEAGIVRRRAINIGMAVALADGGLIVPVIKNADEKTLVRLARDVVDLATRARAKKLAPDDTRGGTFTISNYGVFGGLIGTPVINQPEAAILGVGAVKKRPMVVESELGDQIAIRSMVYLSLSFDHRAFDGSAADQFMQRIVAELEKGEWRL